MAKKTEEKKDESEPGPLKPHLWFRNSVPYEHEVVSHHELHPKLKDHVDEIRDLVTLSRIGVLTQAGIITNSFGYDLSGYLIGATIGLSGKIVHDGIVHEERLKRLYGQFTPHPNPFIQGWKEGGARAKPRNLRLFATMLPYISLVPQSKTIGLEKVFQEIIDNNESPFTRADSPELLKKYHYGIIDNQGNIVLLKHPQDESAKEMTGWQMLKKMFAWKQPFQRTKFEIQKPKIKEKAKQPWTLPRFAPAGMRLALVPIRLRRSRN